MFDDFFDTFVVIALHNYTYIIVSIVLEKLLESFRTVILIISIYDRSYKCIQKVCLMISLMCLLLLHYKLYLHYRIVRLRLCITLIQTFWSRLGRWYWSRWSIIGHICAFRRYVWWFLWCVCCVVVFHIVLTLSNRSSPIMHYSDSNLLEAFRTMILVTLIYYWSYMCV